MELRSQTSKCKMVQGCFSTTSSKLSETNTLFQLFQTNVVVFLLGSVLTSLKEYFGSPIDCIYDGILEQHKNFVDSYCWKHYQTIVPQQSSVSLVAKSNDFQGTTQLRKSYKSCAYINYREILSIYLIY